MKILDTDTPNYPTPVLGRICDRCGYRVLQHRNLALPDDRSAVSIGAELARFISIDLDHGGKLYRADLCPPCAEGTLEMLRPLLVHMRAIANRDLRGVRTFDYQAIDSKTGQMFSVSSIVDDGA